MNDCYVRDDGTIALGEKCLGVAQFKDGHFEPIIAIEEITKTHFIFCTSGGRYAYQHVYSSDPIPYWDNTPFMYIDIKPKFTKEKLERDGWDEVDIIKNVYINTNLCPKLKGG